MPYYAEHVEGKHSLYKDYKKYFFFFFYKKYFECVLKTKCCLQIVIEALTSVRYLPS